MRQSDIMGWLNGDDLLMPGSLERMSGYFGGHPQVDAVYGHRILIDEDDREIGRWILPAHNDSVLTWADFVPQETLFWRRALWDKIGEGLDESFKFAMDWDLLVRFREANACLRRIPYFLGLFRVHPGQKTSSQIGDVGFAEMQRLRTRLLGYPPTRFEIARGAAWYLLKARTVELLWKAGIVSYE